MSVVNAGNGALSPLLEGDPVRPLVAVSAGGRAVGSPLDGPVLLAGILLAPDVKVMNEMRVEVALRNVASALFLPSKSSTAGSGRVMRKGQDVVLAQLAVIVRVAQHAIDECVSGPDAKEDRFKARSLLERVDGWVIHERAIRSGEPAATPSRIPLQVVNAARKIARLGRRIRLHAYDVRISAPTSPSASESAPQQEAAAHQSEPSRPARQRYAYCPPGWIKLRDAARKSGIAFPTLNTWVTKANFGSNRRVDDNVIIVKLDTLNELLARKSVPPLK